MAIDTTTPRSRRAVMAGALGGVLASLGLLAKAPEVRAGTDGDVVLDWTNAAAATTEIVGAGTDEVFRVIGTGKSIRAAATTGTGLEAHSDSGYAVHGASKTGVGLFGGSGNSVNDAYPDPIDPSTGVYGISVDGTGVYGASDTSFGVYAANNATTKAAIAAEGGNGTAIHGHAGFGPLGTSPTDTAIFASAVGTRSGVQSWTEQGIALQALSTQSLAILASGDADGIAGASSANHTGVVGWSTDQDPPAVPAAGPAKTGVYGEATQDANARGVFGKSSLGQGVRGEATTGQGVQGVATTGQAVRGDTTGGTGVYGQATSGRAVRGIATTGEGVRGEATTGFGVKALATTGVALDVIGRAVFSRSGRVSVPANAAYVDVTVPGGLSSSANVLATLQYKRGDVHVLAARPNYPSSGKVRIYLSAVASTVGTTPLAWFVLG
jgi:hypothetical protein